MKPISISEQMMFTTVRLQSGNSCGTGYFYHFTIGDKTCPTIITNKHVVNNKEIANVSFALHLRNADNSSNENINIELGIKWIFHSTQDLCFCFINPLLEKVKQETGKEVFYIPINDSIVATSEKLKELSALEEIVMVGYPIGLCDMKNNFPVFRKGYTASHPAYDFNKKDIGLLDIACFPGSSGSPVFILNENSYSDKKGNIYMNRSRLIFLGTQFSVPIYNANGELVIEDTPTKQIIRPNTPIMTNLAYYIKAEALNEFRNYIAQL